MAGAEPELRRLRVERQVHHLTPAEKRTREAIVKELKHKRGIRNLYAVATAAAEKQGGK